MIRRTLALLLIVTISATAAPVPKELKQRPDFERMKGVWAVDRVGTRWYFVTEKQLFAGGTDTEKNKGIEYGMTIRPQAALPEMDLTTNGNVAYTGIYKFVGDDLIVAYFSGAQRPTDYEPGNGKHVHVLKRLPETGK